MNHWFRLYFENPNLSQSPFTKPLQLNGILVSRCLRLSLPQRTALQMQVDRYFSSADLGIPPLHVLSSVCVCVFHRAPDSVWGLHTSLVKLHTFIAKNLLLFRLRAKSFRNCWHALSVSGLQFICQSSGPLCWKLCLSYLWHLVAFMLWVESEKLMLMDTNEWS